MIRVISGIYKGKRLKRVPSPLVRPMPDKLKEALFNIIQEDVRGSVILDGFAGSGSVGIEALSRGAENAVFIDDYHQAIKVIKANLAKCEAEARARIILLLTLPINIWMKGIR
jgi:16S rRNA (guanine(966)-N(2))-methyltransferase RsmD